MVKLKAFIDNRIPCILSSDFFFKFELIQLNGIVKGIPFKHIVFKLIEI